MKHQDILKKIGVILNELQEQYDFFEKSTSNINDLELELFIANANFLKEHTEILRKLNEHAGQPEKALPPAEKYFEPVVYQAAPQVADKTEPAPANDELTATGKGHEESILNTAPEPIIRHQLNLDEDTQAHAEDEDDDNQQPQGYDDIADATYDIPPTEYVEIRQAPLPELATPGNELPVLNQPDTLLGHLPEKPLTLNQIMSSQLGKPTRLADHLELTPIKDLKGAITLNDKLIFVKDLFNGYSMAYSEAVEILNRFNKFEEADQFLKINYVTKNNWEAKQDTADKFYTLLKRRFL